MVERVEFTKEMKKDYTILVPNMLPVHFKIMKPIFENEVYKIEFLNNDGNSVVNNGLKYVHNDTCYPALLVIGQMIDALNSGKYDIHKIALMITQTGGGCRASNYIHLLRKALVKAGYGFIPVISLNIGGLEKNSGFKLNLKMIQRALAALVYGDLIMLVANQTRPYEIDKVTDEKIDKWAIYLADLLNDNKGYSKKDLKKYCKAIVEDFAAIRLEKTNKIKVGIVGEIYVKYAPLGNNNLEKFLQSQNVEYMIPGVMGFALYCIDNGLIDHELYGGNIIKKYIYDFFYHYMLDLESIIYNCVKNYSSFNPGSRFENGKKLGEKIIGLGCKMGEGWLLTSEIMELCEMGYDNIICTQPFGCLPNHINGKGMVRKITEVVSNANIVAIDYDPSATSVNQENRIKLMLSIASQKA